MTLYDITNVQPTSICPVVLFKVRLRSPPSFGTNVYVEELEYLVMDQSGRVFELKGVHTSLVAYILDSGPSC